MFNQLEKTKSVQSHGECTPKANLPIGRGGYQVFTRMGACWTFNRKRPRGKGVGSASNVGSTPATDLLDVDPDAGHKSKFIVAILTEGY